MYTYKDILFGLKDEYEKNEKELRKLSCFVNLNVRGKMFFHLDKDDNDKECEIHYVLKGKHPLLRPLYHGFYDSNMGVVYSSSNGHFSGDTKDFVVTDEESFAKTVDTIMANPFTREAFNTEVSNNEEKINIDRTIKIYPDRIIANVRNNESNFTSIYIPKTNLVVFSRNKVKLNFNSLYEFLDIEFPKEGFSPFLQNVIESSESFGKEAYFYDDNKEEHSKKFEPLVHDKTLILLRK